MDSEGEAVMMDWEAPLMVAHAEAIAPTEGLDVLNIGGYFELLMIGGLFVAPWLRGDAATVVYTARRMTCGSEELLCILFTFPFVLSCTGFGLGLVDEALQKRKPRTHTIIEAHPAVYDKVRQGATGATDPHVVDRIDALIRSCVSSIYTQDLDGSARCSYIRSQDPAKTYKIRLRFIMIKLGPATIIL